MPSSPPAREVAAGRRKCQSLHRPAARHERLRPMKLLLGPIVGAVSDREARIWLRADDPSQARVHVFRDGGSEVPGSPFRASGPADASGTATSVARLPAAYARYTYDVRDAEGTSALPRGSARPPSGAPEARHHRPFRFGVVSCNDMRPKSQQGQPDPERRGARSSPRPTSSTSPSCSASATRCTATTRGRPRPRQGVPATLRRAYQAAYQTQWDQRWFRRTLATSELHDVGRPRSGTAGARSASTARPRTGRRRSRWCARSTVTSSTSTTAELRRRRARSVLRLPVRQRRRAGARRPRRARRRERRGPLLGAHQWKCVTQWLRDERRAGGLFVVASVPPCTCRRAGEAGRRARERHPRQWTSEDNLPSWSASPSSSSTARTSTTSVVLLDGDVTSAPSLLRSTRRARAAPLLYQLCSSPIRAAAEAARLVSSASSRRVRHRGGSRQDLAGRSPADFGVVELVYEPDRYRITLKLFDESGSGAGETRPSAVRSRASRRGARRRPPPTKSRPPRAAARIGGSRKTRKAPQGIGQRVRERVNNAMETGAKRHGGE